MTTARTACVSSLDAERNEINSARHTSGNSRRIANGGERSNLLGVRRPDTVNPETMIWLSDYVVLVLTWAVIKGTQAVAVA